MFHRAQTRLASSYIFVTLGVIGFFYLLLLQGLMKKAYTLRIIL
ncbi:hypothetical protein YpMG051020_1440 [Yersinia pestis biovar Orientalis str. MG05-1020]|nr:hypothetical protein YpF1991016_4511 [Yersinia pestis biovar Orientalis str. F1991016]EDR43859.1 hypothetical protein YpE1979001_3846 [Yersinia pestis biovar Antiqua str. E1979001]EDR56980.1 hypothetical protein YpMG051020_1440 [Yersinia pestis biovar Orientalis str. MG05-1020]